MYKGHETLNRLPRELARLTSLQSLDLSWGYQVSGDLSLLAGLTTLQELNLSRCEKLNDDLAPLASLTKLGSLDLSYCGFRRFTPEPTVSNIKRRLTKEGPVADPPLSLLYYSRATLSTSRPAWRS